MKEYRYINRALGEFSSEHGYSYEEYVDGFKVMIEASPEYVEALKKEIVEACADPEWSWVAASQAVDFIGVDQDENSVWESVKTLIWNVIAPNEFAPKLRD
tara:strand:+ start:175 stop:477 length:303 start_codon:yes stop_codon:yes gene_type:complete